MQFTATTDYAIRIVWYLASKERVCKSAELSEMLSIPKDYIITLTSKLRAAGILATRKGTNGGYFLQKAPNEIRLLDIIRVMEKTMAINRCMAGACIHGDACIGQDIQHCPMHGIFAGLQKDIDEYLWKCTIADLISEDCFSEPLESGRDRLQIIK